MSCNLRFGFTLVEVLVAMAVLAVAGVAVLKGMDTNRTALLETRDMTIGGMLAAGKMDRVIAEGSFGPSRGRFEHPDEHWGFIVDTSSLEGGLTQVTVSVYEGSESNVLVTLEQLAVAGE